MHRFRLPTRQQKQVSQLPKTAGQSIFSGLSCVRLVRLVRVVRPVRPVRVGLIRVGPVRLGLIRA